MMFAALPQMVVDAGAMAAALVAFSALAAVLWRTPPVQWIDRLIRADREARDEEMVVRGTRDLRVAIDALTVSLDDHRRYVHYHLGPNDITKPIHERLIALELANGIEDR